MASIDSLLDSRPLPAAVVAKNQPLPAQPPAVIDPIPAVPWKAFTTLLTQLPGATKPALKPSASLAISKAHSTASTSTTTTATPTSVVVVSPPSDTAGYFVYTLTDDDGTLETLVGCSLDPKLNSLCPIILPTSE